MKKQTVIFNGVEVVRGWPEKIAAAQLKPSVLIADVEYQRIRYGAEAEDWGAGSKPCRCAVTKGQLHVPGCDVEQCPACGNQMLSCDCVIPTGPC